MTKFFFFLPVTDFVKIRKFYQWLIDEFCDFYHDRMRKLKFFLYYHWWNSDFFSPQQINKFCDFSAPNRQNSQFSRQPIDLLRDFFFCDWCTKFAIFPHEWLTKSAIFFQEQLTEFTIYSVSAWWNLIPSSPWVIEEILNFFLSWLVDKIRNF